jgi:hypothetical protein
MEHRINGRYSMSTTTSLPQQGYSTLLFFWEFCSSPLWHWILFREFEIQPTLTPAYIKVSHSKVRVQEKLSIGYSPYIPVQQRPGKRSRNGATIYPPVEKAPHPFSGELRKGEEGVPVDCGDPWAWETVEAAVEKGAHKLATSEESIKLVQQEDVAYYQVKAGYAKVHTWRDRQKL